MQSIATFVESPPRLSRNGLPWWLRVAAGVLVAGAVSSAALAQGSAGSTAGEKTQAASESVTAGAPDAASQSAPGAPAQWNRRPRPASGVDGQLRRLAADLKLDAAQQAKVRTILVARSEQMQALQHDTRLTPAERRQRVLAIGDSSAEQIRAQLTDAQRAQYIQPRAATALAQAGPAGRRGAMAASPATAPAKGVAQ